MFSKILIDRTKFCLKTFLRYTDPRTVKIRLGISAKLIFLVSVVVFGAIVSVMSIATDLFKEESVAKIQEMNKDLAESLADQTFNIFKDTIEQTTLIVDTLLKKSSTPGAQESKTVAENILRSNDGIVGIGVYKYSLGSTLQEIAFLSKDEALAEYETTLDEFKNKALPYILKEIQRRGSDQPHLLNTSKLFKKPLLTLFFPTQENPQTKEKWLVRVEMRQGPFMKIYTKKGYVTAYLVDGDGNVLVHSDPKMVLQNYNFSAYPIVQRSKDVKLNNQQMEFEDPEGTTFLGAFKKTGFIGTSVVAQVEASRALAALNQVQYRTLLVTIIVLGIAYLFNYIFSQSLTSPLGTLYQATERIAQGNFDVKLYPEASDEIGALTVAFTKMASGLQERDKLKSTFNKFHSKEIAQKILSGEVKLGGEKKMATVFFSDIRGFTSMSERMSPDEVVIMLNEYMTEMVKIIQKHHGVVDKYVGDAIMALWGVPNPSSDDAANCVRAALEMREALQTLNMKRRNKGSPELKIGMGIHTGEVLAGNIGSESRLEYTVIGDTVNQASRLESSTKEIGADILISDTTHALIKHGKFALGPALGIKVKGKADKITVHEVLGTLDDAGNLKTSLTQAERDEIQSRPQNMQTTQVAPSPLPFLSGNIVVPPAGHSSQPSMPPRPVDEYWYLVRDPQSNNVEGPYSLPQMKVVISQPGFQITQAYVFREGDPEMIPALELPGLSRRSAVRPPAGPTGVPMPNAAIMKEAGPSEWYVYGSDSKTHGPYSLQQLEDAVHNGRFTRTTYVWRQGMQNWMYLHQIPGFDRRSA